MKYVCIEHSWKDAKEQGNIAEAIKLIKYQIASNIVNVHNEMSDQRLESPADALLLGFFDDVRSEEIEKAKRFFPIQELFYEISMYHNEENGFHEEEVLPELEELEKSLIEEMEK